MTPRSPDCNSIEHVWEHLQRQIYTRNHQPQNLEDLANTLGEEWQVMDQESSSKEGVWVFTGVKVLLLVLLGMVKKILITQH